MTERAPISTVQNSWFDAEQVDDSDLTTEQNYNNNAQFGFINNHIGSGVLSEFLNQKTLFDSDDSSFNGVLFDGKAINTLFQPSDKNFGNQLEIELLDSQVAGKKNIKIVIIGLDFQGNLQYDTFIFKVNEKQFTKRHYTNILTILFNDFKGNSIQSFNLGGRVIIRESIPFSLSRDPIMVAQDVEPNLLFRDFFTDGNIPLATLLRNALPLFNIDNLNISTGYKENKILSKNDVTSQVGEKFLATTNNIQKISLLLSVQNTDFGNASLLNWHGDLVVSVYPLQSSISCPTDISPNLAIEFSPSNIPLAQISVNYNTLQNMGITLDGNPQPVDFIFSNTPIANGNNITVGNYYAVTVKRSGSADQCDILITTGSNHVDNSRVTLFTGSVWVDIPEENLWFKIYTDAAKITDGQVYETGHGIIIPKTFPDPVTGAQVDHFLDKIYFAGNDLFTGVASAFLQKSVPVQDQRTGNPVFSRQQFVPDVHLLNPIDLNNLQATSNPLLVGLISDKNVKSFDSSQSTLAASLHGWTFVKNQLVIKVIDDITDPRYDTNVLALISNIANGDFIDAKIIPDTNRSSIFYRISKTELISMIYGDVNGDGIVDDNDINSYNKLLGADLNNAPPLNSNINTDGYTTTVTNGYYTYINNFVNDTLLNYQLVNPLNNNVIASGSDGILIVNPNDGTLANFNSASLDFSTISHVEDLKLVIENNSTFSTIGNVGEFFITGIDASSNNVILIRKLHYTSDTLMQIMRADIDCDFKISTNDGYLLQNYILRTPLFPPTSLPASRIGTTFNVIRLTVDPFIYTDISDSITDRTDDFYSGSNRSVELHSLQDIFVGDGYFASHDFFHGPISFNVIKQLSWEDYLILSSGASRLVPTIFSQSTGKINNSCSIEGIHYEVFPNNNDFDPGIIDTFIPNNLIIGRGGELKRPDGDFYKVDFEVGTIVLEIPDGLFGVEKAINVFDDFVADYTGNGITRLGFPAMRFADCSLVNTSALFNNQVRFSVSVQSFSPNTNGTDPDGYTGPIVDGKIGVAMDYATGLLTLNFTNLYQDSVLATLNTKIQISVFLKKGGFNNTPIFVDSFKVQNILNLISVFSGAGTSGGPVNNVNPVFVPIFNGVASSNSSTPSAISAFTFRLDQISPGWISIELETIIETTNVSNTAEIRLFNVTNSSYVDITPGPAQVLTTNNTVPTLVRSVNLTTLLGQLPQDYVYELRLSLNPSSGTEFAYCKMARLTVLYS